MEIEQSTMVALIIFLATQAIALVVASFKQSVVIKSLEQFSVETKRRFDKQEQILSKHTDQLTEHSRQIGNISGKLSTVSARSRKRS